MSVSFDERFGAAEIARRVQEVGRRITADFPAGDLVLIALLKGAGFFMSDLARSIQRPIRLEYIDVIRKGGEEEIIDVHFVTNFKVTGADVVILKDVVRSGIIESYLMDQLREQRPRSVRFACLVDRPQERKSSLLADYVLFPSLEGHLVGYGMEYRGLGGHLPFIGQVKTDEEPDPFDQTGRIRLRG